MINGFSSFSRRISLVFALLFAASVRAALPLADHVPGDAVAYIGWAGADSQSAAYQASDLSAFIDHSNLPDLAKQYLPKLWDKLSEQGGDKKAIASVQKVLPILWRHPVAIYVSDVLVLNDGTPDASVGLICDAGDDAVALETELRSLTKEKTVFHVSAKGALVSLMMNGVDDAPTSTLADNAAFVATMAKLQSSPALAIYVDAKAMLAKADESAAKDKDAAEIWPKVRDALGIANVKTFAMTDGFDGSNWMTSSLLEAPGPRMGLLAVFEPKPIDPALLARIPASAGSVSVYNVDLGLLVDTIGNAMAVRKESDTLFHQASGLATVALGGNFRRQVIGPLGAQWVVYSDSTLHSVVLMNHPTNASTASDSMVNVVFGLTNLANSQIPGATTQPVVTAVQATVKKVDITSAVTRFAAPSVAVKDGILYLGLSADSVVASATIASNPPATDFMHSEHFLAAVKRLGVPNFASFDFCDLPRTAPAAYDNFGKAGEQLRQVATMAGVDVPKVELPPIEDLKQHLSPALSVTWADNSGIYSKSISPFPLSTQLLGDPQQSVVSVGTISMATAIVLPALHRARSQAASVQNMSNEHQMVLAMFMYASDNKGQFPPDLGSLITGGYIQSSGLKIFLLPASNVTIPDAILSGTKDQQATWVNDNAEYKFLLAGQRMGNIRNPSQAVVIVPKDADKATTNVPIGFADGHVEGCKPDRVQKLLHPEDQPPQ